MVKNAAQPETATDAKRHGTKKGKSSEPPEKKSMFCANTDKGHRAIMFSAILSFFFRVQCAGAHGGRMRQGGKEMRQGQMRS